MLLQKDGTTQQGFEQLDIDQLSIDSHVGEVVGSNSTHSSQHQVDKFIKIIDQTLGRRSDFIRKAYCALTFEFAFTLVMIILALETSMGTWFLQKNTYLVAGSQYTSIQYHWWYWTSMSISFILQCILFFAPQTAKKTPINYCMVVLFQFCFSQFLAGSCVVAAINYPIAYTWEACSVTFLMIVSLNVYVFLTYADISYKSGAIFIVVPITITCIFMAIFTITPTWYCIAYSAVIILYGFFLLWETKQIMKDTKSKLSTDDYLLASMMLYGTIIMSFLKIVKSLVNDRDNES